MVAKRLPEDWNKRYGHRPVLLETFVESHRFRGTSYKADNKPSATLDNLPTTRYGLSEYLQFRYVLYNRFKDHGSMSGSKIAKQALPARHQGAPQDSMARTTDDHLL
jgi:hypothetical protein